MRNEELTWRFAKAQARNLARVLGVLGGLLELLLIPVFAFYFLLDWNEIEEKVKRADLPTGNASIGVAPRWLRYP